MLRSTIRSIGLTETICTKAQTEIPRPHISARTRRLSASQWGSERGTRDYFFHPFSVIPIIFQMDMSNGLYSNSGSQIFHIPSNSLPPTHMVSAAVSQRMVFRGK